MPVNVICQNCLRGNQVIEEPCVECGGTEHVEYVSGGDEEEEVDNQ